MTIRHSDIEIVYDPLQNVIWNTPDFSSFSFFWASHCVWIVLIHSLLLVAPEERVQGGLDQGSKAAMVCRSFSKLNFLLESICGSIEGCSPKRGVMHHPVEKQLHPNQTLFSSLVPEWSVYEAFQCIGLRSLSLDDHHHPKTSFFPSAHHTVVYSTLIGFLLCSWGCPVAQNRKFCLLKWPLKWNCASSLKRRQSKSWGSFSIRSLIFWPNS